MKVDLRQSVVRAVEARALQTGLEVSDVVNDLLADALDLGSHELFQVSTSTALVKGVFSGAVSVSELKRHGDFGLGTFEDLDGELVLLDGHAYQGGPGGQALEASDGWSVPFALVTRSQFGTRIRTTDHGSLDSLEAEIDRHRPSPNLFVAVRADGRFGMLKMRAICKAEPGETLVQATEHQSEFAVADVAGTLVGFWSPDYAGKITVPGYHFHFLADDRSIAGHVFDLRSPGLDLALQGESDLHMALPKTAEFLAADLEGHTSAALEEAERGRA